MVIFHLEHTCFLTQSMAVSLPDPTIELDAILCSVANAISDAEQIERLSRRLGFQPADVRRFKQTNHKGPSVTSDGTKEMLQKWAAGTSVTDALPALKAALTAAGLVQIAEMHVPASLSSLEQEQCEFNTGWNKTLPPKYSFKRPLRIIALENCPALLWSSGNRYTHYIFVTH